MVQFEDEFEVIVVGGGTAGVIAAIASARSGAKTLLLEESGSLGGTNTRSLVGPLTSFLGEGQLKIVDGIPMEILSELERIGGTFGNIPDPIGFSHSLTPVNFNLLKLIQTKKVSAEDNLTFKLKEMCVDVIREEKLIRGIRTVDHSGNSKIYFADQIIDATGDADVVAKARPENIVYGRSNDGLTQPMTLIFSLNHVDFDQIYSDIIKKPENFVLSQDFNYMESRYLAVSGYFEEVDRARATSSFPIGRDRLLFFEGTEPNEVYCNTTRIIGYNGLENEQYSLAYAEGCRQVLELWKWLKENIPAFKYATIGQIGELGIRESRRIIGEKQLSVHDILAGKSQEKSIAVGSYPIDIHSPSGENMDFVDQDVVKNYEIDLGMIIPKDLENIMVAGRAISASHEAHASSRVSATCMALGQAAGIIASLAVKNNVPIRELNYQEVNSEINRFGGITLK